MVSTGPEALGHSAMTFSGSLLIALLAIVSDLLLGIAEKKIRKGMHLS